MKYAFGLLVFVGALSLVGTVDHQDEVAYQKYRCEMVMMHEQTKYSANKYDIAGYPPRDNQEVEFCSQLINSNK
jgi:hypothetical protein